MTIVKQELAHETTKGFSDAPENLDDVLAQIWKRLCVGVVNRNSPFHSPTLATVTPDGLPVARTVILREAVREERRLRFNTDARSPKFHDMQNRPMIALHVYDRERKTQLRIQGRAELSVVNERTLTVWEKTPSMSRFCYRVGSAPGTALEHFGQAPLEGFDEPDAVQNFAIIDVTIQSFDWLYLRHKGHMRAQFNWPEGADAMDEPAARWVIA